MEQIEIDRLEVVRNEMRIIGREYCKEYEPAYPITYYNGKCWYYLLHGGHCGVAFVNHIVCLCGEKDE